MNPISVSVIMPVYNTKEEYLREAIESILNQSFDDFEFIIIDDAADTETKDVLNSYTDPRIRIITNHSNLGVTKSLNIGLDNARGKYIARMDSDDISYPDRLKKQTNHMEGHIDINILGSYVLDGDTIRGEFVNISRKERATLFLLENVGPIHPSVMIRREFLDRYGIRYNEEYPVAQDYDLWVRSNEFTDIAFYPEVLLFRRKHEGRIGSKRKSLQHTIAAKIKSSIIKESDVAAFSEEKLESMFVSFTDGRIDNKEISGFFKSLRLADRNNEFFDRNALKYVESAYKIYSLRNNSKGIARRFQQIPLIINGDMLTYRSYILSKTDRSVTERNK